MKPQELMYLVQLRMEGLSLLKETLGKKNIDFNLIGDINFF